MKMASCCVLFWLLLLLWLALCLLTSVLWFLFFSLCYSCSSCCFCVCRFVLLNFVMFIYYYYCFCMFFVFKMFLLLLLLLCCFLLCSASSVVLVVLVLFIPFVLLCMVCRVFSSLFILGLWGWAQRHMATASAFRHTASAAWHGIQSATPNARNAISLTPIFNNAFPQNALHNALPQPWILQPQILLFKSNSDLFHNRKHEKRKHVNATGLQNLISSKAHPPRVSFFHVGGSTIQWFMTPGAASNS